MIGSIYVKIFSGFLAIILLILGVLLFIVISTDSSPMPNSSDHDPIILITLFLSIFIAISVAIIKFTKKRI